MLDFFALLVYYRYVIILFVLGVLKNENAGIFGKGYTDSCH